DQKRELVVRGERRDPRRKPGQRRRQRPVAQEVDDEGQRPRLQGAEPDLRHEEQREQRDALPVRPQVRQRPDAQTVALALRHPPTLRGGSSGRGGTRFGAILGMISGTTRSWLESAT